MDASANIAQVALALAGVVGLVLVCAFVAKRFMGGMDNSGGHIRVVAVKALGARERLVLVEVAGELTLLGVTQNNISALRQVHGEIAAPQAPAASFPETLNRLLGRGA